MCDSDTFCKKKTAFSHFHKVFCPLLKFPEFYAKFDFFCIVPLLITKPEIFGMVQCESICRQQNKFDY